MSDKPSLQSIIYSTISVVHDGLFHFPSDLFERLEEKLWVINWRLKNVSMTAEERKKSEREAARLEMKINFIRSGQYKWSRCSMKKKFD